MKQELNLIEIERESYSKPVRYQPTSSVTLGERMKCFDNIKFHLRRLETILELPAGAERFKNNPEDLDLSRLLGVLTDLTTAILHAYVTFGLQKIASKAFYLSHVSTMQAIYANGGILKKQTKTYKQPYSPPAYTQLLADSRPANPFAPK